MATIFASGWLLRIALITPLTNDVVRQASEWLRTHNILCTTVDQFHHLTGQKPSFTGLVTHGYDR